LIEALLYSCRQPLPLLLRTHPKGFLIGDDLPPSINAPRRVGEPLA
jgi:hypothetical protein